MSENIKTWHERLGGYPDAQRPGTKREEAMVAEIAELRAAATNWHAHWRSRGKRIEELEAEVAALSRRPAAAPEVAAEQPAAGNALTEADIDRIRVDVMNRYSAKEFVSQFAHAIEQHLRAAPQAAQGEGLTIDTPEFRVLLTDVCAAYNSGLSVKKRERAFMDHINAALRAIAAHTRAAGQDGKDGERLDQLFSMLPLAMFCSALGIELPAVTGLRLMGAWAREQLDAAMQAKSVQGGA